MVRDLPGDDLGIKKFACEYDRQGNPVKINYQFDEDDEFYVWKYYDQLGRLSRIDAGEDKDTPDVTGVAGYTYFPSGAVKRKELGDSVQGVDYRYTLRGWLKMINHQNIGYASQDPGGDDDDKFGEIIGYDDFGHIASYSTFGAKRRYNGDISWTISSTFGLSPLMTGFTYNYDGANRLRQANYRYWENSQWNDKLYNGYDVRDITYDANGNFLTLKRYNQTGALDHLLYQYYDNTNRLRNVDNSFVNIYNYDANGNLTGDADKNLGVQYDYRNLPHQMVLPNATLKMSYDANGNRVVKSFITE